MHKVGLWIEGGIIIAKDNTLKYQKDKKEKKSERHLS